MAVFLLSLLLSLCAAPLWRRILADSSWLDLPRSERHNRRVVSRAGGAAWMGAAAGGLVLAILTVPDPSGLLIIVPALAAAFILGRLDDLGRLGPGLKWFIQSAVLAAVCAGLQAAGVVDLRGSWPVSVAAAAVVALLLQTALGIFDNMDGALAVAAAGGLGLLSTGAAPNALQPAAMAGLGATLGFLAWNRPPARLFLGNAGSQPLALLVSALVFAALCKAHGTGGAGLRGWSILLPLGWPLLDLVFVSASRTCRGSVPWHGGRDHTAHLLSRWLGSDRAAFAAVLAFTLAAVVIGLLILKGMLLPV